MVIIKGILKWLSLLIVALLLCLSDVKAQNCDEYLEIVGHIYDELKDPDGRYSIPIVKSIADGTDSDVVNTGKCLDKLIKEYQIEELVFQNQWMNEMDFREMMEY